MIVAGALIIGGVVGVLTGLFGVGGGFLIAPMLNILLGVPMPIAVGTDAVDILGVATAGLYRRRGEGLTDYKMAVVLFGGNYVGVRLGVASLEWLKGRANLRFGENLVPAADFVILCVFLVVLAATAGWLLFDTSRRGTSLLRRGGLFARIKLPPYTDFPTLEAPRLSIIVVSYFGLLLGLLTGLLGIGGGVILFPALVYLMGMRTHPAAATSLALIWLSSFVATISHTVAGNTDLRLAIPLLVAGTVGVQIGISLGKRLAGLRLRRLFGLVILAAIVLVAAKVASMLV